MGRNLEKIVQAGKRVTLDGGEDEYLVVALSGEFFTVEHSVTGEIIDGNVKRRNLKVL